MDAATTAGVEPALAAAGLELSYGRTPVIAGLDIAIPANRMTVVLGPKACGKLDAAAAYARTLGSRRAPTASRSTASHWRRSPRARWRSA